MSLAWRQDKQNRDRTETREGRRQASRRLDHFITLNLLNTLCLRMLPKDSSFADYGEFRRSGRAFEPAQR
jgi:hypothetical protein